jgi:hypothetical protein
MDASSTRSGVAGMRRAGAGRRIFLAGGERFFFAAGTRFFLAAGVFRAGFFFFPVRFPGLAMIDPCVWRRNAMVSVETHATVSRSWHL